MTAPELVSVLVGWLLDAIATSPVMRDFFAPPLRLLAPSVFSVM